MPTDPTGDGAGGFYSPSMLPFPVREDFSEFINRTNGNLSVQVRDGLYNLVTLLPSLHAENLLLAGEDVVWLRRLTSGPRCPSFNENDDQCAVSKCEKCFGTGFYGGYSSAVFLKMSFIPGRADILVEQAGLTITQRPMAWTINTNPTIQEKDIVTTYKNERYIVHSAEAVEKKGRRVYQSLTLSRIDKNDVLYFLDIPGLRGEAFEDFVASIYISPVKPAGSIFPGENFPATIFIKNFIFNSPNG